MCLVFFAYQCHPIYPLIIVGNRDEYFHRPTQPMHWWESNTNLLAGKDLQSGGTWMGFKKNGDFSIVTNFREPSNQNTKKNFESRGFLPLNYLMTKKSYHDYLLQISNKSVQYDGFNLLLGNSKALAIFSNRPKNYKSQLIPKLEPGVYAMSNGTFDAPWPKAEKLKHAVKYWIAKKDSDTAPLFEVLRDKQLANINELPETGIPVHLEHQLSACFVNINQEYGTRSSYVALLTEKEVRIENQEFSKTAEIFRESTFKYAIE
ncbi:MAG: NRDE family protein [Pseudomonadota bacterium]